MNWFDTSGLTSLAKTALKEAQKTIDKALDIQESTSPSSERSSSPVDSPSRSAPVDFLSSWGLTTSAESGDGSAVSDKPITESPSKAQSQSQSVWGSFAGSFFEPPKSSESQTTAEEKCNEKASGSQDDHFSKNKLVANEAGGTPEVHDAKRDRKSTVKSEDRSKLDDKSANLRLNRLSIISCDSGKNSSESVEVLGSQMTTPDSEVVSMQSASHSSSTDTKHVSESVEILPDSLFSPSIECLGFDSCGTRTESSSTNISPLDELPDKVTPTGTSPEAVQSADSVSLVAEEDEDTISYNSVSECTAPTILDANDKPPVSPRIKKNIPRLPDIKDVPMEQGIPSNVMSTENYASSNDGSWSDRTLNAEDSDINLDEKKSKHCEKETTEGSYTDKLSDSSSFYNVNMAGETSGSEHAVFVNVDKDQCHSPTQDSQQSPKEKERVSPISSESRSELVKIGSDRTSTHTSGDELETATSSDIEIIPSPNGDSGNVYCRNSPAKYAFKHCKLDGTSSPHLVDLVLGKSLATKIRGHNRELSEASIQSNTSDESHNSENEKLIRRLCEMTELLEAKDNRLAELSRSHGELLDSNAQLKSQMDSLKAKFEAGESNLIAEDYAQRISALEKKFQQAIKEKDTLRKQLDAVKVESSSKRTVELEAEMKEKDEMISQLQEEGEKLSKQQFTQSNIIKKLRLKEKENEQVIKSLRDKIAEQTSELDRLKRSISAKEELEVSQIEAVYKLTNANKKLEGELQETKSTLDDTLQKLSTTKTSLEAARKELLDLQKSSSDRRKRREALEELEKEKAAADEEIERLSTLVDNLRAKIVQDESMWARREECLRREVQAARGAAAAAEARVADGACAAGAPLLAQLAALQHSAVERDAAHRAACDKLARALAEAEKAALVATERERLAREDSAGLAERVATLEAAMLDSASERERLLASCRELTDKLADTERMLTSVNEELERVRGEGGERETTLVQRLQDTERQLTEVGSALDAEKRRTSILQEQLSGRAPPGDVSPSHSFSSDTLSASLWTQEEGSEAGCGPGVLSGVYGLEVVLARLQRKEGEARSLAAAAERAHKHIAALHNQLAENNAALHNMQGLQEQYDTLLQMYGEKEEQVQELRLDLQDVTKLYKSQLDEMIALRRRLADLQQ